MSLPTSRQSLGASIAQALRWGPEHTALRMFYVYSLRIRIVGELS